MSSLKLLASSIAVLILLLPGTADSKTALNSLSQLSPQNSKHRAFQLSKATPIAVESKDVATIGIADIQSAIPPGTAIGERYCSSSLLRSRCGENTIAAMSDTVKTGYKTIIEEELRETGYSVAGSSESVFSDVTGEDQDTRFLIGATITNAEVHTLESENILNNRKNWKTKGKVTVRWEVLDQQTNKVIYKKETTGESRVPGEEVNPAAYEATRESLKAVLADIDFVVTLRSISATNNLSPTSLPERNSADPVTETHTNIPIESPPTQPDNKLTQ